MSVMIKEICRTLHVILLIKIILFLLINLLWFSLLQVQKIDIGYAKTAKKMDVKKLKGAMWGLLADKGESDKVGWLITLPDCWQSSYHKVKDLVFLTTCLFHNVILMLHHKYEVCFILVSLMKCHCFLFNPKHQENIAVDQHGTGKGSGCVTYPCSFKEIYTKLPEKLSKNMAKNLSVSIAFVCILHLANEKVTTRHSTNHTPSPQKKKINKPTYWTSVILMQ